MSCFSSNKQNKNDRKNVARKKAKKKKPQKMSIEEISYEDEPVPEDVTNSKAGCFRSKKTPPKSTSRQKLQPAAEKKTTLKKNQNHDETIPLDRRPSKAGLSRKPVMRVTRYDAIEEVNDFDDENDVTAVSSVSVRATPSKTRKVREIFDALNSLEAQAATLTQQQSTLAALKKEESKFNNLLNKHEQLNKEADEAIGKYEDKLTERSLKQKQNSVTSGKLKSVADAAETSVQPNRVSSKIEVAAQKVLIAAARVSDKRFSKSASISLKAGAVASDASFITCHECIRDNNHTACMQCFKHCFADVEQRWQRDDLEAAATASYLDKKFQREQIMNKKVRDLVSDLEQRMSKKQTELEQAARLFERETDRQKKDLDARLERTVTETKRINKQLWEMRQQRAQAYEQLNRIRQRFKLRHEEQLKQAKLIIERVETEFGPIEAEIGELIHDQSQSAGDQPTTTSRTNHSAAKLTNLSRRSQKVVEGLRRVGHERISAMKVQAVNDLLSARKRYRKWRDRREDMLKQRKRQQVDAFVDYVGEHGDSGSGGDDNDGGATIYYDAQTVKSKPELVDTALPDVVNWGRLKSGTEIDNMIEDWLKHSTTSTMAKTEAITASATSAASHDY